MTRPTDPQDPTRATGAAADQRAPRDSEERVADRTADSSIADNGHAGTLEDGTLEGGGPSGSADVAGPAGSVKAAAAEASGPGSADPADAGDEEYTGRFEAVRDHFARPVSPEPVSSGVTGSTPTGHSMPTADPAGAGAATSGRMATDAVSGSSSSEPPTVALPPPWQRATSIANGDDAASDRATASLAGGSAETPSPSPSSRRPRGWRAGRTDPADLSSARTVALDPGRPDPAQGPARPADPGPLGAPRAGRPDLPGTEAPPRPPGRGDLPPRPPGRGGDLGRFGLGRAGADPGGDQAEGGERSGSGGPGGFGMGWPRNRRPRQAALQLKRLDPWSVLKIALVLAVVLYLVWLVAVGVLYGVLGGIGVWDRLNGQYADLVTEQSGDQLISAGRVFGVAAVIGAVNSLLFAVALSVGAFIYNVSADLVGGVEVTLSERD